MESADPDDSGVEVSGSSDKEIVSKDEPGDGGFSDSIVEKIPQPVVKFGEAVGRVAKCVYKAASCVLWILASSTFILFGPIVLEVECARIERSRRQNTPKYVLD